VLGRCRGAVRRRPGPVRAQAEARSVASALRLVRPGVTAGTGARCGSRQPGGAAADQSREPGRGAARTDSMTVVGNGWEITPAGLDLLDAGTAVRTALDEGTRRRPGRADRATLERILRTWPSAGPAGERRSGLAAARFANAIGQRLAWRFRTSRVGAVPPGFLLCSRASVASRGRSGASDATMSAICWWCASRSRAVNGSVADLVFVQCAARNHE